MKVIGVVTFVLSVAAILSCGPGVFTAPPAGFTEPITVNDGNNNTVTPVNNLSSTGLNPAHGKPGHRCDIAVGQPLNSKPALQPPTVFNPLTTTIPATKPAKPFAVPVFNPAAGLNPPHGRPGHRCDIKVGEPLNSKPAQTTTTPNTTTTSPTITPTTNTTTVAPGMNPPHGLPGHRCDIAVGQPLNSKPPQKSLPTNVTKDSTNG